MACACIASLGAVLERHSTPPWLLRTRAGAVQVDFMPLAVNCIKSRANQPVPRLSGPDTVVPDTRAESKCGRILPKSATC